MAVRVGQRAERVVFPQTSETERALGHGRISHALFVSRQLDADRNTIRAANSLLSSRHLGCFVKQKDNTETKGEPKWEGS